jgi:hypothetical protein
MYPDMEAAPSVQPDRTVQEDVEGSSAWQGTGGTHGGGKSNLATSTGKFKGVQFEKMPKREGEEEEEEDEEEEEK